MYETTHRIIEMHPATETYRETGHSGPEAEMEELSELMQNEAIENDEAVLYVVRPLEWPENFSREP